MPFLDVRDRAAARGEQPDLTTHRLNAKNQSTVLTDQRRLTRARRLPSSGVSPGGRRPAVGLVRRSATGSRRTSILRPEESWNAEVVAAINNMLEAQPQHRRRPELVAEIAKGLHLQVR